MEHYIKKGLISQADFNFLSELDPSRTKKYLPFIIKSYLADANLDLLRNRVTEYDTLLNRNQVDRKDINSFKTLQQLDEYVQLFNNIKSTRELKRDIKKEADIIMDTDDIFIVSPQSHAASCLYGASTKWCITAENSVHWERYFYEHLITFYYVQLRSGKIKQNLKQDLWKIAVVVYPHGKLAAYDAADHCIGRNNAGSDQLIRLQHIFESLGVNNSLFIPRAIEERLKDVWHFKKYDTELNLSRMGLTKIPDSIGEKMFQLESLILSENKLSTIPESIGLLCNLKTLYLFYNELTSLPESLGSLKNLQWLGLTGNDNLSRKKIKELERQLPTTRIYTQ